MRIAWYGALFVVLAACPDLRARGVARVSPNAPFEVTFQLKDGFKFNPEAPSELELKAGDTVLGHWGRAELGGLRLKVPELPQPIPRELLLEGSLYVCQKEDARVCVRERVSRKIRPEPGAGSVVEIVVGQ